MGVTALPLNFACETDVPVEGGTFSTGSAHVATPEDPLTPNADFYIQTCCGQPESPSRQDWKLHLRGLVGEAKALDWDALSALPEARMELTLECVGNHPDGALISSAEFTGWHLRDVLDLVGVDDAARGLEFRSLEGYSSFLPASILRDAEPMLAHSMNGVGLWPEHGAPVRAVFPGRYGMFSTKWLDSIIASREYDLYGVYRGLGFSIAGRIPVRSRVDSPKDGGSAKLGEPTIISGLALAPGVGIERVELRVEGEWRRAELSFNTLEDGRSPYLWSLWRYEWTPSRTGRHVISVRAFDAEGTTQSSERRFPYDSGAIHSLRVLVT